MIVLVGASHKNTPLGVRERLAISESGLPERLRQLVERARPAELVLLSTCNRVEAVAAADARNREPLAGLASRIADELVQDCPGARSHLYLHTGRPAVEHLFRVASALDSLVVGEPQILGQLKTAFNHAKQARTVGPWLNRVFERAFRVAKRVRTETSLGTGQVSVPTVVADLARDIFGELSGRTALLIGTGAMACTVARLLGRSGARLVVVGRTAERVQDLVLELGAQGGQWEDLPRLLPQADVVISSTSAPGYVISHQQIMAARSVRRGRNLFLVDLAVPRDIDPRIDELDGVFLYNIDDLSRVAEQALNGRHQEAERAAAIVAEEVELYARRSYAERITPTVVALRTHFRGVLGAELDRSLRGRLQHLGATERQALDRTLDAAVDKLLHSPTAHLRQWASDEEFGDWHTDLLLAALDDLFQLNSPESAADEKNERNE